MIAVPTAVKVCAAPKLVTSANTPLAASKKVCSVSEVPCPVKVFDVSVLTNGSVPFKGARILDSVIQIKIVPAAVLVRLNELLLSNAGRPNGGLPVPLMLFVSKFVPAIAPLKDALPVPVASGVTRPARLLDQPMSIVSALAPPTDVASPITAARTRLHLTTKVPNLAIFIW